MFCHTNLILVVCFTVFVKNEACTCLREFAMWDYEFLLNTLGLGNVVIHKEESLFVFKHEHANGEKLTEKDPSLESKGTMKKIEIEFGLKLITIYADLTNQEKELVNHRQNSKSNGVWIKFVPQNTCSLACQDVSFVRESWLLNNGKLVKREVNLRSAIDDKHEHPKRSKNSYDDYSPLSIIQQEYNILNHSKNASRFEFEKKFDLLDVVNRGRCCKECCDHFMITLKKSQTLP